MFEHFAKLRDVLVRNIVQVDRTEIYFKIQAAFYNKINVFLNFIKGDMDMWLNHFSETAGSFSSGLVSFGSVFVSAVAVVWVALSFCF